MGGGVRGTQYTRLRGGRASPSDGHLPTPPTRVCLPPSSVPPFLPPAHPPWPQCHQLLTHTPQPTALTVPGVAGGGGVAVPAPLSPRGGRRPFVFFGRGGPPSPPRPSHSTLVRAAARTAAAGGVAGGTRRAGRDRGGTQAGGPRRTAAAAGGVAHIRVWGRRPACGGPPAATTCACGLVGGAAVSRRPSFIPPPPPFPTASTHEPPPPPSPPPFNPTHPLLPHYPPDGHDNLLPVLPPLLPHDAPSPLGQTASRSSPPSLRLLGIHPPPPSLRHPSLPSWRCGRRHPPRTPVDGCGAVSPVGSARAPRRPTAKLPPLPLPPLAGRRVAIGRRPPTVAIVPRSRHSSSRRDDRRCRRGARARPPPPPGLTDAAAGASTPRVSPVSFPFFLVLPSSSSPPPRRR